MILLNARASEEFIGARACPRSGAKPVVIRLTGIVMRNGSPMSGYQGLRVLSRILESHSLDRLDEATAGKAARNGLAIRQTNSRIEERRCAV